METMRESGRVSGRVANHFKAIIAEGKLKSAKAALANEYVRGNPWSVVGIALAAGALVGYLASRK